MIKKLEAEDIAKILTLKDDDFKKVINCELGQWVQFLMQNVENKEYFMMGEIEDNNLVGYIIMVDASLQPVSNSAHVFYSKTTGMTKNKIILEKMIKWSKDRGLTSIDFITNNVKGHGVYGFKKKATYMEMVF